MRLNTLLLSSFYFSYISGFHNHNSFTLHSNIRDNIDFLDEPKPPDGYEYWNDPRIHNFGNTGFGGMIHARLAPFITKAIDNIAYDGRDIRKELYHDWTERNLKILDFCCGTGASTPPGATGVDTSKEMIRRAINLNNNNKTDFHIGNAEDWGESYGYNVVTCMFGFHEMPRSARLKVIDNCIRVTDEKVVIIDIDPAYTPSESMLSGEPYVLDYLKYMERDMKLYGGIKTTIISGHVARWDFHKTL